MKKHRYAMVNVPPPGMDAAAQRLEDEGWEIITMSLVTIPVPGLGGVQMTLMGVVTARLDRTAEKTPIELEWDKMAESLKSGIVRPGDNTLPFPRNPNMN